MKHLTQLQGVDGVGLAIEDCGRLVDTEALEPFVYLAEGSANARETKREAGNEALVGGCSL